MRRQFDAWLPAGSQLRDLAETIARISVITAPTFLSGKFPPLNFLANAELGGAWHIPEDYSANKISEWKSNYTSRALTHAEHHGFEDGNPLTRRGLALIFDPFVDGFLAAHLHQQSAIPRDCTVIVLSDYYTLGGSIPNPKLSFDWGSEETSKTLNGIVDRYDQTTVALFNCLFGKDLWRDNRDVIESGIAHRKLLLWNFLPMFRGGNGVEDDGGLPSSGAWRLICWELLSRFVAAVGASRVVLACSQTMLPIPRGGSTNIVGVPVSTPDMKPPALPSCVREVYRISHPAAWNRGHNDCPHLTEILSNSQPRASMD